MQGGREGRGTWCRLCWGKGQCAWVDPVSWLSMKVTARDGHHPIMPASETQNCCYCCYNICEGSIVDNSPSIMLLQMEAPTMLVSGAICAHKAKSKAAHAGQAEGEMDEEGCTWWASTAVAQSPVLPFCHCLLYMPRPQSLADNTGLRRCVL